MIIISRRYVVFRDRVWLGVVLGRFWGGDREGDGWFKRWMGREVVVI